VIDVLIADDHPIVRRGLKQILGAEPGITIGEVGTIPELRAKLAQQCPDVLVLDVSMPGGSGLEMLGEIRKQYPKLPVLILSAHREDQIGVRALMGGARGYLTKEAAPDKLLDAVKRLHKGGRFISAELSEALADYVQRPSDGRALHETLSARELTVLKMISAGVSTGQIAENLNLSPKSVSTYRARILEKMQMKSNAELVRYVVEHDLQDS
jgi:two-component system invasion response regulator UvrY